MSTIGEKSPNLLLPYIMPSQAQKHVTHNEAVRALDALVQLTVLNRTENAPPLSTPEGSRYIIGEEATGEWSGRENQLAAYQDGAWAYFMPQPGWRSWVLEESAHAVWTGTDWVSTNDTAQSGLTSSNSNYLINGDFLINQRDFGGGSLGADAYGYDRWKAGSGGASLNVVDDLVTLTFGQIVQIIEAPSLAGEDITVSVEELSGGDLAVDVEGQTGIIYASGQRSGVTLTLPNTSDGDVSLMLEPLSGAVEFSKVKLERGNVLTNWNPRPDAIEFALAQRYFERLSGQSGDRYIRRSYGPTTGAQYYPVQFFAKKRIAPIVTLIGASTTNTSNPQAFNPSFYEFEFYHQISVSGGYTYFGYEADAEL